MAKYRITKEASNNRPLFVLWVNDGISLHNIFSAWDLDQVYEYLEAYKLKINGPEVVYEE